MQHFVTDAAMFTLRDCVIDKLRCTNYDATIMGRVPTLIQPVDTRVITTSCSPMYTSQLWWNYKKSTITKLQIAYNI